MNKKIASEEGKTACNTQKGPGIEATWSVGSFRLVSNLMTSEIMN